MLGMLGLEKLIFYDPKRENENLCLDKTGRSLLEQTGLL